MTKDEAVPDSEHAIEHPIEHAIEPPIEPNAELPDNEVGAGPEDWDPLPRADGGRLVLVPTPIGNLGDVTARVVDALKHANVIACEDTRTTRRLLSALNITGKRLLAVHQHNELEGANGLVALAVKGDVVALVTDAGTPAISDPGEVVVRAFVEAGLPVECLAGPVAFVVALAVSGLPTDRFVFEGFLPAKGSDRTSRIEALRAETRTMALYEAPHRIARTVADLAAVFGGDRRASLSRELSKRFETTVRGSLTELGAMLAASEPRGEYVLVIAGATPGAAPLYTDDAVNELLELRRVAGDRTRDAVDAVTAATGLPRRTIYEIATRKK